MCRITVFCTRKIHNLVHHCSRKNVVNHPAGLIRLLAYSLGLLELPTRTELPLSPPQLIFIEAVLNFNGAESANSVRNIFRLMHHPVLVIACSKIFFNFARKVGGLLSAKSGDPRSTTFFKQGLSIDIQRGNAISVLGTFPYSVGMEQIFYL